jgi:hypothetical protein
LKRDKEEYDGRNQLPNKMFQPAAELAHRHSLLMAASIQTGATAGVFNVFITVLL